MMRHGRGESGTTILEVVVGLAVGALLVAGILTLIEQAQKTYMHSSEAADLQQNVRVGMDRLTRLIQAAGVNPLNKHMGRGDGQQPGLHRVPRGRPELHPPLRRPQWRRRPQRRRAGRGS